MLSSHFIPTKWHFIPPCIIIIYVYISYLPAECMALKGKYRLRQDMYTYFALKVRYLLSWHIVHDQYKVLE